MDRKTIEECGRLLSAKGINIAFAESATAGRAAMEFSLCKDSGKFLRGGIVCYDACLKEELLHVSKELIEQYTPESAEVSYAIAIGMQQLMMADIHIGITGLTASGGSETAEKPVGTMFICGIFGEFKIFDHREVFTGSPEEIILQTVERTAALLIHYLKEG